MFAVAVTIALPCSLTIIVHTGGMFAHMFMYASYTIYAVIPAMLINKLISWTWFAAFLCI